VYLAKQYDLRPLVVHFDNGWNNELAVHNIETIVSTCEFPLKTYVMDWPEFRDLQRAYLKASVIDLEVPTDHMIFAALNKIASEEGIKYILSGNNFATEWLLPPAWYHPKGDLANLLSIHKQHGERKIKNLPKLGAWRSFYFHNLRGIETIEILDLLPYRKLAAKELLSQKFGWRDYGGKHFESIFTRFYQGYILPSKFGIDKRKAHLSNLILNNEIDRQQAVEELKLPPYDPQLQLQDKVYVAKKLGWSSEEFEKILQLPNCEQHEYGNETRAIRNMEIARKYGKLVCWLIRKLTRL
jgi:tRNA(Ile)-lysidine synthase TilS/MesJ